MRVKSMHSLDQHTRFSAQQAPHLCCFCVGYEDMGGEGGGNSENIGKKDNTLNLEAPTPEIRVSTCVSVKSK